MRYDRFRYLWPPRPETAVPATLLRQYQDEGWWLQGKFDGTNCILYVDPNRLTVAYGRSGPDDVLARWQPGDGWNRFTATLPGQGWYVFHAELLHNRGVGVRDTVVLHDVLVADGAYLIGSTYAERYARLGELTGMAHLSTTDHDEIGSLDLRGTALWRAAVVRPDAGWGYRDWLESSPFAWVEGVVLKNPGARLHLCSGPVSNAAWQAKCRRPTDHLSF